MRISWWSEPEYGDKCGRDTAPAGSTLALCGITPGTEEGALGGELSIKDWYVAPLFCFLFLFLFYFLFP